MHEIDRSAPALSRRRILAGLAAATCACATSRAFAQAQPPAMQPKPASPDRAALTSLHYDIEFKAAPQRFYAAILDAKQFADFTGMAAEIDAKVGGAFTLFGGLVAGRNVELVENRRIVQAWRPASWEPGVYSIVHFELKPAGSGTSLAFDHTGFSVGLADSLDAGWHGHYWEPLKKYFAGA
jgi:activator of HSP90 ATPase